MVVAVVTGEDTVQMCQGVPAVVGEAGRVGPWETGNQANWNLRDASIHLLLYRNIAVSRMT